MQCQGEGRALRSCQPVHVAPERCQLDGLRIVDQATGRILPCLGDGELQARCLFGTIRAQVELERGRVIVRELELACAAREASLAEPISQRHVSTMRWIGEKAK